MDISGTVSGACEVEKWGKYVPDAMGAAFWRDPSAPGHPPTRTRGQISYQFDNKMKDHLS